MAIFLKFIKSLPKLLNVVSVVFMRQIVVKNKHNEK